MYQIQDQLCGCGGVLQLWPRSVVMKRMCRVVSSLRISAEKLAGPRECYGYRSLSD